MSEAMRYRVRHETVYRYGADVAHSHQLLHLTPRETARQRCHRHCIRLDPEPVLRREHIDAFGNRTVRLEYDAPHERLEVLADGAIEVRETPGLDASASIAWEEVRAAYGFTGRPLDEDQLESARFRMESPHVRVGPALADYAGDCFLKHRPLLEASEALMRKIHREFKYQPGSTNIRTSALEALETRRGVCQDFAHVMIGCLRARGLAARYVSGYLRTLPPMGAAAGYVGADASHAWVSVHSPPFGWVDLDPTNDVRVSSGHITVAWGRDFGDVSPLRGVIIGGRRHRLSVRVSVQEDTAPE